MGANTYRVFARILASGTEDSVRDPWVTRMRNLPATVVSTTLKEPLDWPDAAVVRGDAIDVVARLKEESEVPLRSHGSLSMNRALMAAGLVDRVQVTLFPVSPVGREPTRSSEVRPTSTWNCSRPGPSTVTSKSSYRPPTGPRLAEPAGAQRVITTSRRHAVGRRRRRRSPCREGGRYRSSRPGRPRRDAPAAPGSRGRGGVQCCALSARR